MGGKVKGRSKFEEEAASAVRPMPGGAPEFRPVRQMRFREPAQVPPAPCPCPENNGSSPWTRLCAAQMKVLTLLPIFVVSVGCCDLLATTEGSTDLCCVQCRFLTHAPVHTTSSNSSYECLTLVAYLATTLALRCHHESLRSPSSQHSGVRCGPGPE